MDSPESNRITLASTSSAVQDSPIFSYLSNLSPFEPVKGVNAAQGFSELNFPPPPPVFTSPRINQQQETSFLKRPGYHQSSSAGFSLHDDSPKILTAGSDVFGTYANQLTIGLIPCTQRECDSKNSAQIQPCSPSVCIDEYLADPVEDYANSAELCLEQANDAPQALQSACSSSKETMTKLEDDNDGDIRIDIETEVAASLSSLEQAKEDVLWKSLFHVKPVEIINNRRDAGRLSDECLNASSEKVNDCVESNLSLDLASGTQHCNLVVAQAATKSSSLMSKKKDHDSADVDKKTCTCTKRLCHHRSHDVNLQNAEGGQQNELDCTPQLLPESLQIVQGYEYCDEKLEAISNGSIENMMSYDLEEASQHQRGMRRRLQFEAAEAHRNTDGNNLSSSNTTNIIISSRLPASPIDLEILDSSHVDSATSSNRQPVNLYQPITSGRPVKTPETHADTVDGSVRNSRNSPITAPVPSGIGLHLNSIANSMSIGCGATANMNLSEKEYLSVQAEKSVSVMRSHLPQDSKSTHNVVDNLSAKTSDDQQESQATVAASSSTLQSPHSMKPLNKSMQLKLIEHDMTRYDMKKSAFKNADKFEEFNQLNPPQKKRKRAPNTIENEGCKRCNCRKSKCLKLYCDCFAAGVYCDEPCACQSCLNKPEYEDTVSGVRQQIESRNPLAFAPKIVQRFTESPANSGENGNRMTPSSARHKRGCNCKKSMCLKKYCECYQANVGCSDGCRCEGCKNIFGAKEGYGEITEMVVYKRDDDERWEDTSDEKLDMVETRSNFLHPEQCHPHNLTPLTPSIQCSNYGKDVPDSRLPARRYLPSPESDVIVLSSFGKSSRSPSNSNNHDRQLKTSKEILDIVSYDQEFDCSNAERLDQFMPRCDGLADICHITPLSHPPARATASSASSNARDSMKISRAQSCHGSGCLSSSGSLRWRSSPITPMPQLGGRKFNQELDSGSVLYNILEDGTPEILKDTPTPRTVKVSSPNQKRVSPPHSRLHELSSPGLRSGRKFILQAIPSFPSLTPYGDPKSSIDKEK